MLKERSGASSPQWFGRNWNFNANCLQVSLKTSVGSFSDVQHKSPALSSVFFNKIAAESGLCCVSQGVLASGGEDRTLMVWYLDRAEAGGTPLMFQHVGHRNGKVVDFQWCEADPWTLLSVSDDTEAEEMATGSAGGGGGHRTAAPPNMYF